MHMGTEAEALKVGGGCAVSSGTDGQLVSRPMSNRYSILGLTKVFFFLLTTKIRPDPTASCVRGSVSESNYLAPKEWSCKKKQCGFDPRVSM